ncbi:hypothetical protein TUM4445_03920 [Shewanella sp. MBTL60-112-B2]|nr:hypothetical protein TUM4444_03200 [Shewanella sp. MBTL60-112-B1]GIU25598.1 hypothetical protein TUM4445_03920 [Shewanella sp. MBTL60-112-B2]
MHRTNHIGIAKNEIGFHTWIQLVNKVSFRLGLPFKIPFSSANEFATHFACRFALKSLAVVNKKAS